MATAAERALQRVKAIEKELKEAKDRALKAAATAKTRENQAARKVRERKKYLVGALIFEQMEKDANTNQQIQQRLAKFLTRPNDRALFGLEPLPETTATQEVAPAQAEA